MDIYMNDNRLNIEEVSLTDFSEELKNKKLRLSNVEIDFASISSLKGEKNLLEMAFKHTLKEFK